MASQMQTKEPMLDACSRSALLILNEIDDLVQLGYRDHKNDILQALIKLSKDDSILNLMFKRFSDMVGLRDMIGAQCFLLHSGKSYYARLNFWLPRTEMFESISKRIENYFSIGVLHNHSFDFFTVGVHGPGYRSQFFECSSDPDGCNVGDYLPLVKASEIQLSRQTAIFVPKTFTYHVQYEPESYSISLNIIPKVLDSVGSARNTQLIADPVDFKVTRKFTEERQATFDV